MQWADQFRRRILKFESNQLQPPKGVSISFKVRVTGGCFHREHSPFAYRLIDQYLHSKNLRDENISFQEHESGPEVLVYLALAAGVLNISANVINLITAIIKARSEGIRKGDRPDAPVELIVRGFDMNGKLQEEKVLTFHPHDKVDTKLIETALQNSLGVMVPKAKKNKKPPILINPSYSFTPMAKKRWDEIPKSAQTRILNNVFCVKCSKSVSIVLETAKIERGSLILRGKCKSCGQEVCRVVEPRNG